MTVTSHVKNVHSIAATFIYLTKLLIDNSYTVKQSCNVAFKFWFLTWNMKIE